MKRVTIIGTQGVPAQYGGFESLVENLVGEQCDKNIKYTVFCSGKAYKEKLATYKNAELKYVNLDANGAQSIPYDIISFIRATRISDVILVLGVSGCCFLPIYRLFAPKKRLVINIDGLEHRREKWGKWAKRFLKFSEKMAIKFADLIITDNKGIQDYVMDEYGKESTLIAYGGDHAISNTLSMEEQEKVLTEYNLIKGDYSITVCRIEPENNCHITLEAFSRSDKQLVFIGNWEKSEYGRDLKAKYSQHRNIKILDPIYDINTLYALRNNAAMYIHGHSAGGTNPSLVEAMFFGKPIIAYSVVYNKETTENSAMYFKDVEELYDTITNDSIDFVAQGKNLCQIADKRYTWNTIIKQYEATY